MQKYSVFSLIKNALKGHKDWEVAWKDPTPKKEYDVIIIGGGGHGLATAYYLAKEHNITKVAIIEKGWIGGGNVGRNTTIIRSNYMHDENGIFSEFGMNLWRNMSQDLNFNVMFSPRGIINLAHSDAQMNVYSRRGNSMRLNGIDAVLLNREEVKKIIPMADFSENVRFPIFGGLMQPSAGTARHDAVAWGYARQADSMGVDIIQNCEVTGFDVSNGKILRDQHFKDIWIQPAAGDAGGALGVALAVWHKELDKLRTVNKKDSMKGAYLGPAYDQKTCEQTLKDCGAKFETFTDEDLLEKTAQALIEGKAIGWFQGRMEFGPRALGARSILGDARSETMQKVLNLKVKYRESFRPFAPSVLREDVSDWFGLDYDSPYMLLVDFVKIEKRCQMSDEENALFGIEKLNIKRSEITAVTHVDYSARIQTVHKETNPIYHALIRKFKEKTGCSVIVNTSFNVRGEPIVSKPEDAFRCFMGTEIEMLVIGNCILRKEYQDKTLVQDYKEKYELD